MLASCAVIEPERGHQVSATDVTGGLFDAWNDAGMENAAVAKLVRQADTMMKYNQWDEARGKLERTLRLAIDYAPAWSRLSWLSLREARHNKAIQLAHRSNSYTDSAVLQYLNWTFIRDANKLMGNETKAAAASKMLQRLKENL